ncbi:hypothetical protein [Chroococcus sp. FPU101]|uniref:hypothetical protein n=1 Tax=Chroococcus sp. FPU101 TaxID=1974212 RepID=UPI001A906216|nr:hypothetical protein [Chroococcus sp. FPU101]GFE71979.1 hypothetical protein CFPU101_45890 [Chroococcus sp. FPU101]
MTFNEQDEKDLLASVENEEWISVENFSEEKERYQADAQHQIVYQGIKSLLSPEDRQKIEELANQLNQSIPSVTRDILHKYLQGELVEKTG